MASRTYSTCFKTIFDNLAIKHNFNGFEVMRYYGRWVHRKPLRVINPEDNHSQSKRNEKLSIEKQFLKYQPKNKEINDECIDNDPSTLEDNLNNNKHSNYQEESEIIELEPQTQFSSSASKSLNSLSKTKRVELTYKQKASFNAIKMKASAEKHCVPLFSKLNDSDPKFSNIMTLVKSKNKREKGKLILLEGKRLIAEAILSGFPLQTVFFSRLSDLKNLNLPSFGVQVYKLPYKTLSLWSDVSTSPGIVGIMKIPPVDKKMPGPEDLPLTILCDNIREPGNLGTILRTAAAVGCHQVLLTKGCVDLWSPKVLRSGAGSHFRLRIHKDVTPENYYKYIDEDSSIFLADNNVDIEQEEESQDNSSESDSDSESENENKIDSSEHDIDKSEPISQMNYDCISLVPYYSINYTSQSSIVLVIGGETEGLSNFSYSLAYKRSGMRLNVPLSNNVNSLNTGTALGIIAFEIKRQFLSKQQIYKQDLKQSVGHSF